jgi:hypothetical protein
MYAQFNDESMTVVTGISYSPLPEDAAPFQSEIQNDDPRYRVWWDALLPGTITSGLLPPTD